MICRYYPTKQEEQKYKYSRELVEIINRLKNDEEFQRRFNLFKQGINYKTGKPYKEYSSEYRDLINEFILKDLDSDTIHINIYYDDVKDMDYEKFLKNCDLIDEKNISIRNRNNDVDKVIEQIKQLQSWDEYVEFEYRKYGISPIFGNIHRENDCFGNIINIPHKCYTCKKIIYGKCCYGFYGEQTHKCDKCDEDLTHLMYRKYPK